MLKKLSLYKCIDIENISLNMKSIADMIPYTSNATFAALLFLTTLQTGTVGEPESGKSMI